MNKKNKLILGTLIGVTALSMVGCSEKKSKLQNENSKNYEHKLDDKDNISTTDEIVKQPETVAKSTSENTITATTVKENDTQIKNKNNNIKDKNTLTNNKQNEKDKSNKENTLYSSEFETNFTSLANYYNKYNLNNTIKYENIVWDKINKCPKLPSTLKIEKLTDNELVIKDTLIVNDLYLKTIEAKRTLNELDSKLDKMNEKEALKFQESEEYKDAYNSFMELSKKYADDETNRLYQSKQPAKSSQIIDSLIFGFIGGDEQSMMTIVDHMDIMRLIAHDYILNPNSDKLKNDLTDSYICKKTDKGNKYIGKVSITRVIDTKNKCINDTYKIIKQ